MNVNPTVIWSLLLLIAMIGSGITSATWGLRLGREALQGITQPDARPTSNLVGRQDNRPQAVVFLKEAEILSQVKQQTEGTARNGESP